LIKLKKRLVLSPVFALAVLISMLFFCPVSSVKVDTSTTYIDRLDYWPTNGWFTSTPEAQSMNSTHLEQMRDFVLDRDWTFDSILVIRNGYMVFEFYPNPEYNVTTVHDLGSAAKSITGAIIGVALENGDFTNLNNTVVSLFPDRIIANLDVDKETMTVEHLLTMSSGLDWIEDGDDSDLAALFEPIDFVQYILDKPMAHPPGTYHFYSSADSHLLSSIINETTGMSALEYGFQNLFHPLGITDVEWWTDSQGVSIGAGWLNMTPRDMAKIGYLYLHNGSWDGQQIIPSSYIESSIEPHFWDPSHNLHYGYQLWVDSTLDAFEARGAFAQRIWVQPKNDLVVVFTGPGYNKYLNSSRTMTGSPEILINGFILPALLSETTTTPTPESFPISLTTIGLLAGAAVLVVIVLEIFRRRR